MPFGNNQSRQGHEDQKGRHSNDEADEKPLTCMIYFFASQMPRNIQVAQHSHVPSSSTADKGPPAYTHRLDTLLSEVKYHAHLSPFVNRFETYPVDMPPPGPPKNVSREAMHDTMLLVKFPHKRAWDQWIMTKEWQHFMEKTESEKVFREMPHVRCATSVKGLHDPADVART